MEQKLKESLEEMAKEEGRSLNNLINHLLKCAVVSNGIIRMAKAGRGKIEADTMLFGEKKINKRTWFGNDVAYDFPNCKNYKDGRCEVYCDECKNIIYCNENFNTRWDGSKRKEKEDGHTD